MKNSRNNMISKELWNNKIKNPIKNLLSKLFLKS